MIFAWNTNDWVSNESGGKKNKKVRSPTYRIRTSDLRISCYCQLQSSALPTELRSDVTITLNKTIYIATLFNERFLNFLISSNFQAPNSMERLRSFICKNIINFKTRPVQLMCALYKILIICTIFINGCWYSFWKPSSRKKPNNMGREELVD